jgi:hypothetical protein
MGASWRSTVVAGMFFCGLALAACSEDHPLDPDPGDPDGGTGTMDASHPADDAGDGLGPVTDGGRGSTGATGLPCEVQEVLAAGCGDCHGDPPRWGAPMALVTWEDTQQPAVSDPGKAVHELMKERLHDTEDPMPPARFDDMTADEKAVLDAWLDEGAPAAAAEETCAPEPDAGTDDGDGGVPDSGSNGDGHNLPCEPDYEFRAFDPADPEQGYEVPTGGDGNYYKCFAFEAPFAEGEQGIAWGPLIDDERTIHHWILWESPNHYADGSMFDCGALPDSDSLFLAGWAPGGGDMVMPEDVGLKLTPGSTLLLQVHYYNVAGLEDVRDRSGMALCTGFGRPREAGVVAVGPMDLNIPPREEATHSLTCPGAVTKALGGFEILASNPHAHELATRFTTEIVRNEGTASETVELLTDVNPWDFNDQTSYPQDPPVVVNEGDGIRVTCEYYNHRNTTATWGENTEDEMCFDFLLVTPLPTLQPIIECANRLNFSIEYDGGLVCQEDVVDMIGLLSGYESLVCSTCSDLLGSFCD